LNAKEGEEVEFPVLLLQDKDEIKVGTPYLQDVSVRVKILRNLKGSKVLVLKFKRRKRYKVLKGHRQLFTEVEVKEINVGGRTS
jgi:large subunit ribosomal protein L21